MCRASTSLRNEARKTWMAGTSPAMTETGVGALLDHDLAGHAELGVGHAVAGLDVATQVAGAAGRDRHQPPFGGLSRIDLDLADRALEFRERHGLAVLLLRHLHLAREHHLRERMRGEVMRIAARVAQDQLVELAGFKLELLWREFVFAGCAEIDRHLDRRLPRQVACRQRSA